MSHGISEQMKNSKELRMMVRSRNERKKEMRKRLIKRDLAYAENAAPVTIEERDLRNSELGQIMRIEWRGQRVIGARAVGLVKHL